MPGPFEQEWRHEQECAHTHVTQVTGTYGSPETHFVVMSKSRLIASWVCHLLVIATKRVSTVSQGPNQRKADSQTSSRIWGAFVNSERSFLEKQGEFTKPP